MGTIDVAEQLAVLTRGVETVLPEGDLERKLESIARGERGPLRVKFGMDPTAPDIHIGHAVVLRKLREFQELGHTVVAIVGGFTARLGDPSGRSATRPQLSAEEVRANAATYVDQARKILLPEPLEIVDNGDWLEPLTVTDMLALTSRVTVARMLERKDFAGRYKSGQPIAIAEFLYPILQAQDSVAIGADIEFGGTDQLFNLIVGRELQSADGQDPQTVMIMPLLEGIDGTQKMSKTAGNAIGITEPPAEMFGKVMRIPDTLMRRYYMLASGLPTDQVTETLRQLDSGALHANEAKRQLARAIVSLYHSPDHATQAEARFNTQFRDRGIPEDVPEVRLAEIGNGDEWFLPALLVRLGFSASNSEARRLVGEGGIRLDGQPLTDATATIPIDQLRGRVLQRGKRRFVRLS